MLQVVDKYFVRVDNTIHGRRDLHAGSILCGVRGLFLTSAWIARLLPMNNFLAFTFYVVLTVFFLNARYFSIRGLTTF
jgi:hypothetical protein